MNKIMDKETRDRLAGKSGENNSSRPPKYECPLIRFDGNRGTFRKVFKNKDGENEEVDIKTPVEFVILKKRRNLSSFSTNQSYFSNEHNTSTEKIMLFKVVNKTVTLEDIGFTADLRQKYQTLKTHEVVYVLYDGEVCKMEIKGGSLGGYYDYQKSLTEEELHSFEVTTVVSSEKAKSEGGFGYFKMTFDHKALETDFGVLEQKIDEVSKACLESDNYTKQKMTEKAGSKGSSSGNLTIEESSIINAAKEREMKAKEDFDNYGKGNNIDADSIPF